jgi:hypothetical protein
MVASTETEKTGLDCCPDGSETMKRRTRMVKKGK